MSLFLKLFKRNKPLMDKENPIGNSAETVNSSRQVQKKTQVSKPTKKKNPIIDNNKIISKTPVKTENLKQVKKKVLASGDENYKTVKIGDQLWMAENLKVTCYRNGDPIPNAIEDAEWTKLSSDEMKTGAYCVYNNNPENFETYGLLYNWHAINDKRNLAPEGWHVATDEDWKVLEMHLGISQSKTDEIGWRGIDQGGMLKEVGTLHWNYRNSGSNNKSNFTAMPGGLRAGEGKFLHLGDSAFFWTSSNLGKYDACYRELGCGTPSGIYRGPNFKSIGFSVRCIKD